MDKACRLLTLAGVDSPEIDARRIVEAVAEVSPSELDAISMNSRMRIGRSELVIDQAVARFDSMLARRCAGEPLQYVIGNWGFRTLDLLVDERVLIPRPETEIVAGWAITKARELSTSVLVDLGTGSGAIALAVAVECPQTRVFATDVSEDALAVARTNLAGLAGVGLASVAADVTLHAGDWFDALPDDLVGSVDVIVSNPPYVSTQEELPPLVADWEPSVALRAGTRGDEHIVRIIDESPVWLRPGGSVVVEIAPHQSRYVLSRASEAGFSAKVEPDLTGRNRVLIGVLKLK